MKKSFKQRAAELKVKISALFLAMKRKDTPLPAKIVAGIAVAYALSPIDLIPDFIPVLGYLDDIIVLPLLVALAIRLIPREIMGECEAQAKGMWAGGKPKKWVYALPVVAIWVIIITLIIYKVFFTNR